MKYLLYASVFVFSVQASIILFLFILRMARYELRSRKKMAARRTIVREREIASMERGSAGGVN